MPEPKTTNNNLLTPAGYPRHGTVGDARRPRQAPRDSGVSGDGATRALRSYGQAVSVAAYVVNTFYDNNHGGRPTHNGLVG